MANPLEAIGDLGNKLFSQNKPAQKMRPSVAAGRQTPSSPPSRALVAPSVMTGHHFNAPDAEAVLGMRRLLVKVVSAKGLPDSTGPRRSCSAEVQLVTATGEPIPAGTMHVRTGPANHFATVKDTAPVWNAEFVAELQGEWKDAATL